MWKMDMKKNEEKEILKTLSIENSIEETLHSCNNDDPTDEQSEEIKDFERENINLRPRENRNFKANIMEFTVTSTNEDANKSSQIDL